MDRGGHRPPPVRAAFRPGIEPAVAPYWSGPRKPIRSMMKFVGAPPLRTIILPSLAIPPTVGSPNLTMMRFDHRRDSPQKLTATVAGMNAVPFFLTDSQPGPFHRAAVRLAIMP